MSEPVREDQEISLAAVWDVLWRYRLTLAMCSVVAGGVAAAVAFMTTPIYQAQVVVTKVQDQSMAGAGSLMGQLGGLAGMNLNASSESNEAVALLRSQYLIGEFLTRNNLVNQMVEKEDPERRSLWWASRGFRNNVLSIDENTLNGTITVSVKWIEPAVAADWANKFVDLANELMRMRAMKQANSSIAYLQDQLAHTQVIELRRVFTNLIETETKKLMLTNAQPEYSFKFVDPARPPELRIWPQRTLMVIVGGIIGLFLGSIFAFVRHSVGTRWPANSSRPSERDPVLGTRGVIGNDARSVARQIGP